MNIIRTVLVTHKPSSMSIEREVNGHTVFYNLVINTCDYVQAVSDYLSLEACMNDFIDLIDIQKDFKDKIL